MYKIITRNELQKTMEQGQHFTLIEALPARYYEDKHLPGAINIQHDEIEEKVIELLPDKDSMIVVYCASTPCKNSGIAASALDRLGYRNVYEYVEGKEDWESAGLPFEQGKPANRAA